MDKIHRKSKTHDHRVKVFQHLTDSAGIEFVVDDGITKYVFDYEQWVQVIYGSHAPFADKFHETVESICSLPPNPRIHITKTNIMG